MKTPALNLHEWLRRLGYRGDAAQPDFGELVLPVAIAHDGSPLASPTLPPTAMVGCNFLTTATRFACFELVSKAPGGLFVERCLLSTPTAGGCRFRANILPPPFIAIGFPNAAVMTDLVPNFPVSSTGRFGENAATQTGFATLVEVDAPQLTVVELPVPLYVQPGFELFIEAATVTAALNVAIRFRELPALPST